MVWAIENVENIVRLLTLAKSDKHVLDEIRRRCYILFVLRASHLGFGILFEKSSTGEINVACTLKNTIITINKYEIVKFLGVH